VSRIKLCCGEIIILIRRPQRATSEKLSTQKCSQTQINYFRKWCGGNFNCLSPSPISSRQGMMLSHSAVASPMLVSPGAVRVSPYFFPKKWWLFLVIDTTPTPLRLPSDRLYSVLCKFSRNIFYTLIMVSPPGWCHPGRSAHPSSLVTPLGDRGFGGADPQVWKIYRLIGDRTSSADNSKFQTRTENISVWYLYWPSRVLTLLICVSGIFLLAHLHIDVSKDSKCWFLSLWTE